MSDDAMHLIAGNANRPLAEAIAKRISVYRGAKTVLTDSRVERFNDSEIFVEIFDNVRGQDVFIIQPTSSPANDNLMELMIITDALRRASARRIAAVMPYFGYARQDRKTAGRTPISAKLVADLIERAGVTQVLTMDLHAGQIQGFFGIPVDNLYAAPVFALDLKHHFESFEDVTVVSPDVGGVVRARDLAKRIGAGLAIVDKRRVRAGEVESMTIIGEVKGQRCIIVDDICDTAGTLCKAAELLIDEGASEVHAYISHGVLSDPACERVSKSVLKTLVVTDSIQPTQQVKDTPNIRVVSIAPLFAQAILNVKNDTSVSSLFDEDMLAPIYEAFYRFD
jgi:ribose-phosphate pyrophosphokinase